MPAFPNEPLAAPASPHEPAAAQATPHAPSAAQASAGEQLRDLAPAQERALCVAIHDVAPSTWDACSVLLDAVRAVADIPLTWLVVPCYHGAAASAPGYERMLGKLLDAGHELALHGYTHLDTAPARFGGRLLRQVYTQSEGEFAAIDASEARQKIDLGLDWFERRRWAVSGFVAPAWLLGAPAWQALRGYPFAYTTTMGRFHLLQRAESLVAPSLVYAARNGAGRVLSPPLASAMARLYRHAPLLRFALHPRDARHPALLRHAQTLLAHLLDERTPMTKASFTHSLGAR